MRKPNKRKSRHPSTKKAKATQRARRFCCVVEDSPQPPSGPSSDPWYLYIVRCSDGTLYTGIAKNVTQRIEAHNQGKGAKYTRTRGPVTILFQETLSDYSSALKREYQVKRLGRKGKEAFIEGKPLKRPAEKSKMSFQKKRSVRKKRKTKKRKMGGRPRHSESNPKISADLS